MYDEINTEELMDDIISHKFKTHEIKDVADDENRTRYPKKLVYKENTVRVSFDLIIKFATLSKDAIRVLDWICRNLPYNGNRVFIHPAEISRQYGLNPKDKNINKGVKQLVKENILTQANTLNSKYASLPDCCYIVNIEYIIKGNCREINEALKIEKDSVKRYEKSIKEHQQKAKEEAKRINDLINGNY